MEKITVTLSEKAKKYFHEVQYSLDRGDGKVATQSDVINHILEASSDFEDLFKHDILGFVTDFNQSLEQWDDKKFDELLHKEIGKAKEIK